MGAAGTGKSTLARALVASLEADGMVVAHLDGYRHTFSIERGRAPRQDEQAAIAAEQTRRITAARDARLRPVDVVVADTTALVTAVYSELVFGDTTLYAQALADHRQADLTLLMAPDLPHPADVLLREALLGAGIGFSVIGGQGPQRLASARAAWAATQRRAAAPARSRAPGGWRHHCGRCGDPSCEQHLFSR
ncbi:AAA family ATPase [Sphaerotilus sp.]|uniref:AAA family ATPase n=1 Tax=Sphaerotilus sp. TaxID=2093942 RepID=UPI0034E2E19F